jgi:hypothetical protein
MQAFGASCTATFPAKLSLDNLVIPESLLTGTRHNKADCPNPRQGGGGGGGGGGSDRACFNCGQTGHSKSDCTNERVIICRNCDEGKSPIRTAIQETNSSSRPYEQGVPQAARL